MRAGLLAISFVLGLASAVIPALASSQSVIANSANQFTPKTVTVTQGESVTWTNGGGFHNVQFDDGSFTDPPNPSGASWTVTRTFDTAGTFRYHCAAHGQAGGIGMSGTVVVQAAGTPAVPNQPSGQSAPPVPKASPPSEPRQPKKKCISRRKFQIRLREPRGKTIKSANVTLNGKPLPVVKRRLLGRLRQTAEIDLRGRPKGAYTARIRAVLTNGDVLRGVRVYRTCAAKRTPRELPTL